MIAEVVASCRLSREEVRALIRSLGCKVTGVIGPYVLRYKNNKLIVSLRPVNFKMSDTEKAKAGRAAHASATKFAKFLYEIKPIQNVWENAKIDGHNTFNKILKFNKKLLIDDHPSVKNIITPGNYQLYLDPGSINYENGKIKISDEFSYSDSKLIILMVTYNPVSDADNYFNCMKLYDSSASAGQVIILNEEQKSECKKYKKYVLFSSVISEFDGEVFWSNTVAEEGSFNFKKEHDFKEAEECGYGQIQFDLFYIHHRKLVRKISRQPCIK